MRIEKVLIILIASIISLTPRAGQTCTAFTLENEDEIFVGKNYDWNVGDGLVIVNKRNVYKTAALNDNPASWISKYGSVTFNQYGRELPNGGMNEAGLVVEVLWLRGTQYPSPDHRSALGTLQWIQYQLDNHRTVGEVIDSDSKVRISSAQDVQVHYFICDSTGDCAIIEFLNGKMVYHTGDSLPAKAITNNTYAESAEYLKLFEGYGGELPVGDRNGSVDPLSRKGSLTRFVRAINLADNYDSRGAAQSIDYMFETLSAVDSGDITQWNIVYDIGKRVIYFKTKSNSNIKHLDMSAFDFDCDKPVKLLDINADLSGNVAHSFDDYSIKANRRLLENSFKETYFLKNTSEETLDYLSTYPELTTCGP